MRISREKLCVIVGVIVGVVLKSVPVRQLKDSDNNPFAALGTSSVGAEGIHSIAWLLHHSDHRTTGYSHVDCCTAFSTYRVFRWDPTEYDSGQKLQPKRMYRQ